MKLLLKVNLIVIKLIFQACPTLLELLQLQNKIFEP